jgi:hypothetical protein
MTNRCKNNEGRKLTEESKGMSGFSECDTKTLERSDLKQIQDSVQPCRHPAHAELVTTPCEAAGNVQGKPEPSGRTGLGEGRTGEREQICASVVNHGHRTLADTMIMGSTRSGVFQKPRREHRCPGV